MLGGESAGVNAERDHLANDEIRTVVMETVLQLKLKMFLTLADEILHFHALVLSDVLTEVSPIQRHLTCCYSYSSVILMF